MKYVLSILAMLFLAGPAFAIGGGFNQRQINQGIRAANRQQQNIHHAQQLRVVHGHNVQQYVRPQRVRVVAPQRIYAEAFQDDCGQQFVAPQQFNSCSALYR